MVILEGLGAQGVDSCRINRVRHLQLHEHACIDCTHMRVISQRLFLSVSIDTAFRLKHTPECMHTQSHRMHVHPVSSRACTHTHTHTPRHTHTLTLTLTHRDTHTPILRTHTHTPRHTHTLTLTLTHRDTHTHRHTDTHAHSCVPMQWHASAAACL
jgi:hypothetical protein